MSPHLFGWDSLDSVTTIARSFQLLTVIFFALGLVLELISLWVEDKKYHGRLQWIGLLAFSLCAGAEFGAYKYDGRRDFLVECKHQDELRIQKQIEDDLRQKLKDAQEAAEQSYKNARDARQGAEEVKEKMAWRTIPPGSQKSIVVKLKKFSLMTTRRSI